MLFFTLGFSISSYADSGTVNEEWKTIYYSAKGINRDVKISTLGTGFIGFFQISPFDIRLLGKRKNVLWEKTSALKWKDEKVFWCGKDVYYIELRTHYGVGNYWIY